MAESTAARVQRLEKREATLTNRLGSLQEEHRKATEKYLDDFNGTREELDGVEADLTKARQKLDRERQRALERERKEAEDG
jgi:ABC-type phosphate transport system auxiliary subunit